MMWLHSRDLQHEHRSALHPLPLLQLQADVIDLVANHSESTCPHPPKMKLKCRGAGIFNATWFWIVKCSKMLRKSWLDWKDARLQGVQIKTDKSLTYILQAPSSHSVKDPSTSDVSIPMSLAFYCAITRLSQEDWKRVAPYGTAFAKGCLIFLIGVQLRRFLATFAGHWLGHYPYVDHGQNHNDDGNKIIVIMVIITRISITIMITIIIVVCMILLNMDEWRLAIMVIIMSVIVVITVATFCHEMNQHLRISSWCGSTPLLPSTIDI